MGEGCSAGHGPVASPVTRWIGDRERGWHPRVARSPAHVRRRPRATRRKSEPLLTPRSSAGCARRQSQTLAPPRSSYGGCSALVPRSALRASTSTRFLNASWRGCTQVWHGSHRWTNPCSRRWSSTCSPETSSRRARNESSRVNGKKPAARKRYSLLRRLSLSHATASSLHETGTQNQRTIRSHAFGRPVWGAGSRKRPPAKRADGRTPENTHEPAFS